MVEQPRQFVGFRHSHYFCNVARRERMGIGRQPRLTTRGVCPRQCFRVAACNDTGDQLFRPPDLFERREVALEGTGKKASAFSA